MAAATEVMVVMVVMVPRLPRRRSRRRKWTFLEAWICSEERRVAVATTNCFAKNTKVDNTSVKPFLLFSLRYCVFVLAAPVTVAVNVTVNVAVAVNVTSCILSSQNFSHDLMTFSCYSPLLS